MTRSQGARVVVGPGGGRDIAFAEFPAGFMTPAMAADELMTAVRIPLWHSGHGHAFVEFARRHGDFAIASAAALLEADERGRITRASLTIGGVTIAPRRMGDIEQALIGQQPSPQLLRELCERCRALVTTGTARRARMS